MTLETEIAKAASMDFLWYWLVWLVDLVCFCACIGNRIWNLSLTPALVYFNDKTPVYTVTKLAAITCNYEA